MKLQIEKVQRVAPAIHGLKPAEFGELLNFIFNNQINDPPLKKTQILNLLDDYGKWQDLPAMYRFLQWSLRESEPMGSIMATIGHDLNGFRENFFSPRTSSY